MATKKKKPLMTVQEMASLGGKARAESLTADELSKSGKKAANSRWSSMSEEERKAHGAMLAAARAKKRGKGNKKKGS